MRAWRSQEGSSLHFDELLRQMDFYTLEGGKIIQRNFYPDLLLYFIVLNTELLTFIVEILPFKFVPLNKKKWWILRFKTCCPLLSYLIPYFLT